MCRANLPKPPLGAEIRGFRNGVECSLSYLKRFGRASPFFFVRFHLRFDRPFV